MADIVGKSVRSKMMSAIRSKNTKIELEIRHRLWAKGFRYKLHTSQLPGKPDLVFPRYKAVIFINGCFWHGHNCSLFRIPKTRIEFWTEKIGKNQANDAKSQDLLSQSKWHVYTIWECMIRGKSSESIDKVVEQVVNWLQIIQTGQDSAAK